jgi:MFS family permease
VRAETRLVGGHALAATAMSLPWPLLAVLVWDATGSSLLLGVTAAARMAPYVALSWWAGRLADRGDRGRVLRATVWLRLALLLVAAVALGIGAGSGAALVVAVVASAVAVAVATPAYPALAAAVPTVAGVRSARATEWLVTAEVGSFVVGPAVAGLLIGAGAGGWVPWLAVAGTVGAALAVRRVPLPAPASVVGATDRLGAVVRRERTVRWSLATLCAVNLVVAAVGTVLLPLADRLWRGGDADFGVATAVLGFGGLAGPGAAGAIVRGAGGRRTGTPTRTPPGSVTCIRSGLLGIAVATVLLLPSTGVAVAAVPLALLGALAVQVESCSTTLLQDVVPDRLRASVFGLADTVMVSAALVGSLAAPVAADLVGVPAVIVAVAALGVLVALSGRAHQPAPKQISGAGVASPSVTRASASASAGAEPAASPAWTLARTSQAASSEIAVGEATTQRAPAWSQAAVIPTVSSAARTEPRPSSHAESSTVSGTAATWSMS